LLPARPGANQRRGPTPYAGQETEFL